MIYINKKGNMMKKNQQVQLQTDNQIAAKPLDWGMKFVVENLIMPKVLLQQKMSERVEEGKAKPGDMVDNLSDEVLGSLEETLEVIPFRSETTWIERKNGDFAGVIPFEGNERLAYEEEVDGVKIERDKVINVFILIPLAGLDDVPYIIPFKRTSMKAGKKIETRLWRNTMAGLNPCEFAMKILSKKVAGDKGTYYVYDVLTGRKATPTEAAKCFKFNESILSGQRKVDYSEEASVKPSTPTF
jgi:hypothetical protein